MEKMITVAEARARLEAAGARILTEEDHPWADVGIVYSHPVLTAENPRFCLGLIEPYEGEVFEPELMSHVNRLLKG